MGTDLNATFSTIGDTQEILFVEGRTATQIVLDAIALALPRAVATTTSRYPTAFLTPNEALAVFAVWRNDLVALTDEGFIGARTGLFGADLEDDTLHALVLRLDNMRDLAEQGYNIRFEAV